MGWFKRFRQQYSLFIVVSIVCLLVWQWLVQSEKIPSFIIPTPTSIVQMMIHYPHELFVVHLVATFREVLIGFLFALVGGIGIAIAMYFSKPMEKVMYPLVLISQTIPIIALSPIFILWFGYGLWSKVAVTILVCFFPIVLNFYDGLKQVDREYIDLLKTMGASKWQCFIKVEIPFALPYLFSGMKLAVVFAVVGATIGEWLGASEGLGYYSRRMSGNLNAEGVFAAVTILSLLGMVLFIIVRLVERKILSWNKK